MKNKPFPIRTVSCAAVAVALSAGVLGVSGNERTVPGGQSTCTLQCSSGEVAGCSIEPVWHRAIETEYDKNGAGEPHADCHEGTCSQWHPCPPSGGGQPDLPAQIDAAVEARDVATLAKALADPSSTVRLNLDRQAVQVLDCRANVVAHFPVPSELVNRLRPLPIAAVR